MVLCKKNLCWKLCSKYFMVRGRLVTSPFMDLWFVASGLDLHFHGIVGTPYMHFSFGNESNKFLW